MENFENPGTIQELKIENNTILKLFEAAVKKHGDSDFLGTRHKTVDGYGPYEWQTYKQIHTKV